MSGRPRDAGLEQRLLSAAWTLLTSRGYDALTVTEVAAQANAHRTDVYRRWPNKAQLVTAALAEHLPPIADVDTGSLYRDLRAFLQDLGATWSSPWSEGVVGLLADLRQDPAAEATFRGMNERRAQPLVNAIARAVRRGEIGEVPDLPLLGNLLEGPLLHRRMFGRTPLTPDDLDAIAVSAHGLLTGVTVTS